MIDVKVLFLPMIKYIDKNIYCSTVSYYNHTIITVCVCVCVCVCVSTDLYHIHTVQNTY